jgi:putative ABC transport system permease protein
MVTHNPELAERYASRIIRVKDGIVTNDTDPYTEEEGALERKSEDKENNSSKGKKKEKKASMSFATAFSLSLNNLMTKKARTMLTSVAGSIGIIGIALILALSNGIKLYINAVQEDTLSTYPLSLYAETQDMSAMLGAMMQVGEQNASTTPDKIYVDDSLGTMMSAMSATVTNDLEKFKKYLEENMAELDGALTDIQYTYDFDLQIFTSDGKVQISPTEIFKNMGSAFSGISEMMESSGMGGMGVMSEMIDNKELLDQQYELVGENSHWPENANEVVLVISENNQISKMTLYMLGVLDQSELEGIMKDLGNGEYNTEPMDPYEFDDFIGMTFKLVNTEDFFEPTKSTYTFDGVEYPIWTDLRESIGFDREKFVTEKGTDIVISGIVRPREGTVATSISGAIGYTADLTQYILKENLESKVIDQQNKTPEVNVLTGLKFERTKYTPENINELIDKIDDAKMEQLYVYITQMIKNDPDFSARLDVKDAASFGNVFFLLPSENKIEILKTMIAAANQNPANAIAMNMLCGVISNMMEPAGAYNVNSETLPGLLHVMDNKHYYVLVNGLAKSDVIPMDIPGLSTLAGETTMNSVYESVSAALKEMTVNEEVFKALLMGFPADSDEFIQLEEKLYSFAPQIDATFDSIMHTLGNAVEEKPTSINFYAKDFASKDRVEAFIKNYNESVDEKDRIEYTDIVGIMMSSVTTIIDVISYVLIAFVSISLVVSSIMIAVITYISVLERTKEIGILRAIGASKKNITSVFNAETLIIGLASGIIGIGFTVLFCIPANIVLRALTDIPTIGAKLPVAGGIALIILSVVFTVLAGAIPSKMAAKRDPVIALRSE